MSKSNAGSRLQKELMDMMMTSLDGISAFPENDNLFSWLGTIRGAGSTAYEGLEYRVSIQFPAADDVTVTDIYPAREQPIPGVTSRLVIDALSDRGVLAGYTPSVEAGAARLARRARPGDVLLVVGAGDVDRAVDLLRG